MMRLSFTCLPGYQTLLLRCFFRCSKRREKRFKSSISSTGPPPPFVFRKKCGFGSYGSDFNHVVREDRVARSLKSKLETLTTRQNRPLAVQQHTHVRPAAKSQSLSGADCFSQNVSEQCTSILTIKYRRYSK